MQSDIEIAQHASMRKISEIAEALGLPQDIVESYGHYKAKIACEDYPQLAGRADGKLILVTAISPTPAGEGKTTTTVGLGDALNLLGKQSMLNKQSQLDKPSGKTSMICIREPALGPVFGMKGGAAGGGYAQVVPMEDINLHFTGDFAAIAAAHNLLSALIDNHIHHGNALQIDPSNVSWKRVLDMNDRALRKVVVGLGGKVNGTTREDGFDIVVASEVMAIFCLADGLQDLKQRLGNIVIGYSFAGIPIQASDLQAHGAMTVLLKNAIKPNLVQTLENTPALIHGGPFANIAHGCNSVIATRLALKLADYVVTEAGFGADLGAEKFIDIKCRKSGLRPSACVIVATIRALKYHGGVEVPALTDENLPAVEQGFANLLKHVQNVTTHYGLPCVVSINRFNHDTDAEIELVRTNLAELNIEVVVAEHWSKGSQGALALAVEVVRLIDIHEPQPGNSPETLAGVNANISLNANASLNPSASLERAVNLGPVLNSDPALNSDLANQQVSRMRYVYEDSDPLWEKMRKIATRIYGAADIAAPRRIKAQLDKLQADGYGHYPICVAKTQYSFTTDAAQRGAVQGHTITVREIRLCAGAEFLVLICDDIMTMPGLPKEPCAMRIDIDASGQVMGLF